MSVTIVCGGQIGSEGKGKIIAYLANESDMVVRTGGPNAGHTIETSVDKKVLHMLPCGIMKKNCILALGAASFIDVKKTLKEIVEFDITPDRLFIDNYASIIDEFHIDLEKELFENKLSTESGVGTATSDRVLRKSRLRVARDVKELLPYCTDIWDKVNKYVDEDKRILVEGVQGMDLSLYHGSYPFVTSRDVSPGTLMGDIGLSPNTVGEIVLVLRTYPIRSCNGPLYNETEWEQVSQQAGMTRTIKEMSTVTKRLRRVGEFDFQQVYKAIKICRPTQIALNFIDYIDSSDYKKTEYSELSVKSKKFIERLESEYGVPVTLIGTGPMVSDIIDRRKEVKG